MNQNHSQTESRDERLAELILQYIDAMEAEDAFDRDSFLTVNPEFREELEQYFASRDQVERLIAPIRIAAITDRFQKLNSTVFRSANAQSPQFDRQAEGEFHPLGQLGEFRLLREIGRGGMGTVYEADQLSLQRRVAVKVLPFAAAIDAKHILRFKNEALAAAMLNHPNIVPVYSVGNERGVHFYSMQLVEGQSLASLIAELRQQSADSVGEVNRANDVLQPPTCVESVSPIESVETDVQIQRSFSTQRTERDGRFFRTAARLMLQASEALQHAHESGVVHRDIKPANLLIDLHGQLKITDFGLAQIRSEIGLTRTGDTPGTLRYMSPEQAAGKRAIVDHRTDVYSLGATFYELLTFKPIFEGNDVQELLTQVLNAHPQPLRKMDKSIPIELEIIVLKATNKSPEDRYCTSGDLAADLRRFLENKPILAKRPSVVKRAQKWAKRNPSIVMSGLVFLSVTSLILLAAFVLVTNSQRRERIRADEAEKQFHLARRSVDELVHVCNEELAYNPATVSARRRLLTTALSYYQEFIAQRRGDMIVQADLSEAAARVERILQGLRALRVSGQVKLLKEPWVVAELQLGDAQRAEADKLLTQSAMLWQDTLGDLGRISAAELDRRFVARSRLMEADLKAMLASDQLERLYQLDLQDDVAAALCEPEVSAKIRLTDDQRDRIKTIEQQEVSLRKGTQQDDDALKSTMEKQQITLSLSKNERILGVLDADQMVRWRELTGMPLVGTSR